MRSRPSNFPLSHCPGAVPFGLGSTSRTFENVCLLGIVGRHFPATRGESPLNAGQNFFVSPQRHTQSFGHGFAGKVILGRTEPAAENHDLRAKQRMLRGCNQPLADRRRQCS